MSKPLTEEQLDMMDSENTAGCEARKVVRARLDFLERKVQAAEQLARKLATSNCLLRRERETLDDAETYGIASLEAQIEVNRKAIETYDEVTE